MSGRALDDNGTPPGEREVLPPLAPRMLALYTLIFLASLNVTAYATLLTELQTAWSLTNTQAGLISSAYFLAYTIAVPVLTALTDRVPARNVLLLGLCALALGAAVFALMARDLPTAMAAHALMGLGFAGTYMPGLKALSDIAEPARLSRSTSFYTSSFSVATGASYALMSILRDLYDWQTAMLSISAAAGLGVVIAAATVRGTSLATTTATASPSIMANLSTALRNRTALGYSLAYGLHCWELFAMRTWVVAYLSRSVREATDAAEAAGASVSLVHAVAGPAAIAAIMTGLGFFASIFGNELSRRIGRQRAVTLITLTSAVVCLALGIFNNTGYAVLAALSLLHGITSLGESASVTAGALASAKEGMRGATMALHSMIGFTGGFFGPLIFGLMLDWGGSGPDGSGWLWAFAHLAVVIAATSVLLRWIRPAPIVGDAA